MMSIQIQIVKSFGQSIRSLIIMISSFGLDLNLSEPCRSARSVGQVNADNVVTGESGQWRAERVQPDYSCRRKVCPEAQFFVSAAALAIEPFMSLCCYAALKIHLADVLFGDMRRG